MTDENDIPEAKEILAIERTDYFKIGLSLTVMILLLAAIYVFVEYDALYKLKPNEFGDFLAGIFGPLVLLWVVMGFLQQGAELKYSREALLLQAKELKASVEAQRNMGEAAWAGVHAERDAKQSAEFDKLKAIQPVFVVNSGSTNVLMDISRLGGRRNQFIHLHFTLANLGKDALDVELQLLNANLTLIPSHFARLARVEMQLRVETESAIFEHCGDCELEIRYGDIEGNRHARRFQLRKADQSFVIADQTGEAAPPP